MCFASNIYGALDALCERLQLLELDPVWFRLCRVSVGSRAHGGGVGGPVNHRHIVAQFIDDVDLVRYFAVGRRCNKTDARAANADLREAAQSLLARQRAWASNSSKLCSASYSC